MVVTTFGSSFRNGFKISLGDKKEALIYLSIKETLNKIRAEQMAPLTINQEILRVLSILTLGMLLGLIAKYSDTIPSNWPLGHFWSFIKDITTRLGIWILLATIIGAWSRNPKIGAIKVFAFFIGMLLTYYIYSAKLFGFFPTYYFLRWGLIALVSPLAAYIVWFGRGQGWIAALCAALPIGLLAAQGYSFLHTFAAVLGFDFLSAIALFIALPQWKYQHFKVLPLVLVITILLRHFHVIGYLLGV